MLDYEALGKCHPKLSRGQVWCRTCRQTEFVDSADCLRNGWPKCCGHTMTIDAPEELSNAARNLRIVAPTQPEPSLGEWIELLLIQRKQALQALARADAELLPLRRQFARDRGEFLLPSVERLQRELLG